MAIDESLPAYELADRMRSDRGRVFLSGSQALARLAYQQLRDDRRRGWNTAAYVSGYPGSPLANFDGDARAAAKLATAEGLTMLAQPALNEELAAAAVMGTQLAVTLDTCRYDGVLGVWYGKAPGLDRAGDAIRHGMFSGTSARGGALLLVGDDPIAKSSTLPSASDAALANLNAPVFFPGDVQDVIDLGRHAIALSRASGLWTAIKVVESVADGTGTVDVGLPNGEPLIPTVDVDGVPYVAQPTGMLLTPHTLGTEQEFAETRLQIARRYGVDNALNYVAVHGSSDWIGVVASGTVFHEVRAALRLLGLGDDDALRGAGIRLLRIGMPFPLDAQTIRDFAPGLAEVVVVEEKTPLLEQAVRNALYDLTERPRVVGKQAPDGASLFPAFGGLAADAIAPLLRTRLQQRLSDDRLATLQSRRSAPIPLAVTRTPHFCSGCPHNTSTRVPEGTMVGAGIGCHTMTLFMDPERVGSIIGVGSMGSEGAQWIGMSPFVGEQHIVQNIGDGTLFHSGLLAIRAAAASGVNITYKILYNGAVAMTGGQNAVGELDVIALVNVLQVEGVRQVIITTEDTARYRALAVPADVKVWDRSKIIEAQELLATVEGCTVLIHDQRCAAELRRDRKRGTIAAPTFRVIINERVCEGCGDCGDTSNCLSVQPIDTPYGRKTKIDQQSCNFDLSCMDGDCPAFATVTVDSRKNGEGGVEPPTVPDPAAVVATDFTIRMSGIGGTGVVTVSQVLGTAAMLDGYAVRGLDQTGLSQKAGPVVSDLRLTRGEPSDTNKATRGSVDLLLAFDRLVAGSDAYITASASDRTVVVANTATTPTARMVVQPQTPYPNAQIDERLDQATRQRILVDASGLVDALLGDSTTSNIFVTGVAVQSGHLPLTADSVERAITLNGVAVDRNIAAFRWGRAWANDPVGTARRAGLDTVQHEDLLALIARLRADLDDYQNKAYAQRFADVIDRVQATGHEPLTRAVAVNLHKLMAYKDEYEVARLLLLPESRQFAESVGGRKTKVTWRLHPPMLRSLGRKQKMQFGPSSSLALRTLRASTGLRGTLLDPFGHTRVRRLERSLVPEYIAAVDTLLAKIDSTNLDEATAIAGLPDQVRGYEELKMRRAAAYRDELATRLASFGQNRS